jgi:hypothetical protein
MMDFSERSEYVGANVKPEIKRSLQEYIKNQREVGVSISMSRWISDAIQMRLEKEEIPIISGDEEYSGEPLPFPNPEEAA